MSPTGPDISELIRFARSGDREALGRLLETHRAYLKILSRRHLDGRLAARIDDSDLIQQTCLSAFRNFNKFQGTAEGEFVAWLLRIHEQNLQNVLRDNVHAQKRAVGREQSLDNSQLGQRGLPTESAATPSRRAMQGERAVQLALALDKLPESQCEAVRLRHLEGWSLAHIATKMQRSEDSVVGLIQRGMKKLKTLLGPIG